MASGGSFGITLPIEMVRKLKWREKQKVVVKLRGKKITVEDWPVRQVYTERSRSAQDKKK